MTEKTPESEATGNEPCQVRLPGFSAHEDIGMGYVIKRASRLGQRSELFASRFSQVRK
jgi:hypothetical protein